MEQEIKINSQIVIDFVKNLKSLDGSLDNTSIFVKVVKFLEDNKLTAR